MKSLFAYEFKKLSRQKLIVYSIVFLLLINVFNIVRSCDRITEAHSEGYSAVNMKIYKSVCGQIDSQKLSSISEHEERLNYILNANLKVPDEYKNQGCNPYELRSILTYHKAELERIASYNEYSEKLSTDAKKRAETAGRMGNTYLERANTEIAEAYNNRRITSYYDTERFCAYFEYGFSSFLILLIAMLSASSVFAGEVESGMERLIYSAKNGRASLTTAKLSALSVFLCLVCFAFGITDFFTFRLTLNLEGLSVPLYSISDYKNTPLSVSIGGFIVICELLRVLGVGFIGIIISFASLLLRKSFAVFPCCFVLTVALMLMSAYSNELLDYVNTVNPISMITASNMLRDYNIINFFGYPIYGFAVSIVGCGCSLLTLSLIILGLQKKR